MAHVVGRARANALIARDGRATAATEADLLGLSQDGPGNQPQIFRPRVFVESEFLWNSDLKPENLLSATTRQRPASAEALWRAIPLDRSVATSTAASEGNLICIRRPDCADLHPPAGRARPIAQRGRPGEQGGERREGLGERQIEKDTERQRQRQGQRQRKRVKGGREADTTVARSVGKPRLIRFTPLD